MPAPTDPALVFDAVDIGLIVIDEQRLVGAWNAWLEAASGLSRADALDRRIETLFPNAAMARLSAAVDEALDFGASSLLTQALHGTIFPLTTRAGRPLLHNVIIGPLPGASRRVLIQITDVTVAVERDRVLRDRQNARYSAVVDGAPDAILTLDAKAVIQMANPAAARELGYSGADLIGRPISLVFDNQGSWATAWAALLAGEALQRPVELEARRKDGSISFVEMSASRWISDSRVFVTAILRDVNERRAAEDALVKMNQTLERRVAERTADRDRMWRLSTDLMLVAKLDGEVTDTNPAWEHVLGRSPVKVQGRPLGAFVVQEDWPVLDAALRELAASPAPRLFELRMTHRSGAIRTVAWSAVALDDQLQAVGRDVTAERQAQATLRETEEALRQSQKMEAIGQLTGGIAHDFNNMLTGIIGSIEIIRRRMAVGKLDDVEKFMAAAVTSANRAAALTHRLLAFARQQPLDPQPLDVNQLIGEVEDLLTRTLGEQVRLQIHLGQEVWPALTDANQLENAILNLAINARDAMPEGGMLTIETSNVSILADDVRVEEIEPGDYTVISVTDTGIGMSPQTVARAFDPFFTTKPIGQGTGLGLSMIYGFAKQSRGQVRIRSALGEGSTISLYLPRFRGGLNPLQPEARREAPQGSGETVLVVEDDPSVRLLIGEVLRDLGYSCMEASDGQAAMPLIASNVRVDLMITDVGLPGLNGRQLAEIAREHRPGLRILFVTGYAEHATDRGRFLAPGMEMITKPFTLDALAVKIREMIAASAAP
ncbi:MAG: PAS domain S-box protein [Phenylobacterium sp.]